MFEYSIMFQKLLITFIVSHDKNLDLTISIKSFLTQLLHNYRKYELQVFH